MRHDTIFSSCRRYRYTLWREWDMFNHRYLMVIGLNPSIADETLDDPTIRRCIGFATQWGYGALCMTNLFAYRATAPHVLYTVDDPVGADNTAYLLEMAWEASMVLAAWGCHGQLQGRGDTITHLLDTTPLVCLGRNKDGTPKHPLYVAKQTEPQPYRPGGSA